MAELYYGVPDQIPNYQTQIDQGMADSKEALDAARTVVINRREKDREFKTNLYKNDLGEMYDGDRESAEKMRQYIEYQYEQGLYNDDPSKFARIVADYNAQIDMFTGHYKNTHGIAGTADGTGNTYLDVQLRQQQNNSDKFWGETGNRVVGNEFDQAQETYNQLNAGLQGMNVDEAGNFVATDPLTGDTVRISDLAKYQLGNSAFMPDLEKVAPPTLYDVASAAETATAVKLRMQTVKEDGSAVTADEAAGAEFDNLMGTRNAPGSVITERQRKFRELTIRDLADQAGLGLSDEEIEAFITGDLSNHPDRMDEFAFMIKKARETFIDVNRFGGEDSGSRRGDSSIPGLSGQSRNINVNAGGIQITEDSDASGDPDARSTRVEGETLSIAAYQLDEPIEESETNPNGAYSVTHVSTGPRGEHMVVVEVMTPMVRDIETGNLRPATADDASSNVTDIAVPEQIDIDGDDPRAEEIRRNLAARGITDETWVSMGQDTNRRLQEDNERRRGEIEEQNQRAAATDVQPDNRIPTETLPPALGSEQEVTDLPASQTNQAVEGETTPQRQDREALERLDEGVRNSYYSESQKNNDGFYNIPEGSSLRGDKVIVNGEAVGERVTMFDASTGRYTVRGMKPIDPRGVIERFSDFLTDPFGLRSRRNTREQETTTPPEDPILMVENLAKKSSEVIASIADNKKDEVQNELKRLSEQNEGRIFAEKTQNSVGDPAIGFLNEAGETVGDLIFI